MPLIEVTDEQYEFLKNLKHEMETQDNRGTAQPYFYQIKRKERIYGEELQQSDGTVWVNGLERNELTEEEYEIEKKEEGFDESDWTELQYQEFTTYTNVFLTEKACEEHIQSNKHHYLDEPVSHLSYVDHAWRNPEMEKLYEIILSVK